MPNKTWQNYLSLLFDVDPARRRQAIVDIQAQERAPGMVAPLAQALKDPDEGVRAQAAIALGDLGRVADPALPRLRTLLCDAEAEVRFAAAAALARLRGGISDWPTLELALASCLAQQDLELVERLFARWFDEKFVTPAIPAVLQHLLAEYWDLGEDIAALLKLRWPHEAEAWLSECLRHDHEAVRSGALWTLRYWPVSSPALIEQIIALLDDSVAYVRTAALGCLALQVHRFPQSEAVFFAHLQRQDRYSACHAVGDLLQHQPTHVAGVQFLRNALQDPDSEVVGVALHVLDLCPQVMVERRQIEALFQPGTSFWLGHGAAQLLGRWGHAVLPLFLEILRDPTDSRQQFVSSYLWSAKIQSAQLCELILEQLDDPELAAALIYPEGDIASEGTKQRARTLCDALALAAPAGTEAVLPWLLHRIQIDPTARFTLLPSLLRIGVANDEVFATLRQVLQDDSYGGHRQLAAHVLEVLEWKGERDAE